MFLGDDVIAQAWSHTDTMKETPYLIKRQRKYGKTKITYVYTCSCPAFMFRGGGKMCKHIQVMLLEVTDRSILRDDKYNLSDLAMEIFGLSK